ncbi:helix-turn-helix domain-containing protein [Rathayibacter sp. VKM Ac-2804]|uniref:helix-turn-helix domain-containing protein n=1 Tax=unclassified Rathayibacter TaxID=2609250 RepID=UPI00132F4982|nr:MULTISPECIES: helix-turn-helix transcriptional regulator [unclassified Rathayibacter]NRG39513.1 helix-turn-helix domain-containing protein [Rathayibacter sp. VKM Ac-2835]QHF24240.1 helix-turn-helix domain-containing protein [Rathayibacter sp. VKM Ac-2804]
MTIEQQERDRSAGFSALLREWRDRSAPGARAPAERSRRSPGLRREELAALAGISVDYLVQLEQGRSSSPSPTVVAALVRALRLGSSESAVLYRAAGLAAPASAVDRSVPPRVQRLVDRLPQLPVAVYAADWWLLEWNSAWSALMGDPMELPGRGSNQVWFEFTRDTSPVWVDAEQREQYRDALVGDLRVASVEHREDAELEELVQDLLSRSTDFAQRWRTARPVEYRGATKRLEHPSAGTMTLDGDVLRPAASTLRLVLYSAAPGSPDATRLSALLAAESPAPGQTRGAAV